MTHFDFVIFLAVFILLCAFGYGGLQISGQLDRIIELLERERR